MMNETQPLVGLECKNPCLLLLYGDQLVAAPTADDDDDDDETLLTLARGHPASPQQHRTYPCQHVQSCGSGPVQPPVPVPAGPSVMEACQGYSLLLNN